MYSRLPGPRHALLPVLLAGAAALAQAEVRVTGSTTLRVGQSVVLRAQRPGAPQSRFTWDRGDVQLGPTNTPHRFDAVAEGEWLIEVWAEDDPADRTTVRLTVLPREGAPLPPSGRHLWTAAAGRGCRDLVLEPRSRSLLAAVDSQLRRVDLLTGKPETILDLRPREGADPIPGMGGEAQLEQVCRASDGSVYFTVWNDGESEPAPQVWRCAGGQVRLVAGQPDVPEDAAPAPEGILPAAVPCVLDPRELVAGPEGSCFLTDWSRDQVLRIAPRQDGGFDLAALAGMTPKAKAQLDGKALLAAQGDQEDALQAILQPQGLALAPDGSLVVLDRDGRIGQLRPGTRDGRAVWSLAWHYAPTQEDPHHPGEPFPTGVPERDHFRLAVDDLGTVYLAGENGGGIWASAKPLGQDPLSFVPIAGADRRRAWEEGGPSERLRTPRCIFLAPMAGGLLVAGDDRPIRYVGPPLDAALARLVRAQKDAEQGEAWGHAAGIIDRLRGRLPDALGRCVIPLAPVSRKGDVLQNLVGRGRLAQELAKLVATFILDPWGNAFRASRAIRLVEAESPFERTRTEAARSFRALEPPEQTVRPTCQTSKRTRTEDEAKTRSR